MKNKSNSARALWALALALGIAISLSGCGSDSTDDGSNDSSQGEQATTTDKDADAADDANSGDIVDPDGEIPGWLSDGFPLYPGSEVAAATESGDSTIISFSVPSAEAQEIYDWFLDQYGQKGWTVSNPDAENMSFTADNTDGRSASINVTDATFVVTAAQG